MQVSQLNVDVFTIEHAEMLAAKGYTVSFCGDKKKIVLGFSK